MGTRRYPVTARPAMIPGMSSHLRQRRDGGPAGGVAEGGLVAGSAAWWSGWAVLSACGICEPSLASAGTAPAGAGLGSIEGSELRSLVLAMLVLPISVLECQSESGGYSAIARCPDDHADHPMILMFTYLHAFGKGSRSRCWASGCHASRRVPLLGHSVMSISRGLGAQDQFQMADHASRQGRRAECGDRSRELIGHTFEGHVLAVEHGVTGFPTGIVA